MAQNPTKRKCPDDGPENATCVGKTGIDLDTFSFTWEISNYSILSEKDKLESPLFRGGPKTHHGWKLVLQPKNKDESSLVNYVSLYLEFVQYGTPLGTEELRGTPIKTHFQISILDGDGQPNTQVFQNREKHNFTIYGASKSWGQAKVITSADLVDPSRRLVVNDTVKIFCQLWISGKITKKVEFFQDSGPSKEQRTQASKDRLVNDLRNALSQSIATDVTVSTGETTFKAHKAILSARSSVFAAMFDANMIERETATVQIVDFDDEVVKGMLEHLYTGETTVMDNRAQELLQIAEKYNLDGLKEDCEYAVGDKLSKGNAAEILALACTHNVPILKAQVIRFISRNKEELMKMESFQDAVNAFAHTGVFVIC